MDTHTIRGPRKSQNDTNSNSNTTNSCRSDNTPNEEGNTCELTGSDIKSAPKENEKDSTLIFRRRGWTKCIYKHNT